MGHGRRKAGLTSAQKRFLAGRVYGAVGFGGIAQAVVPMLKAFKMQQPIACAPVLGFTVRALGKIWGPSGSIVVSRHGALSKLFTLSLLRLATLET